MSRSAGRRWSLNPSLLSLTASLAWNKGKWNREEMGKKETGWFYSLTVASIENINQ